MDPTVLTPFEQVRNRLLHLRDDITNLYLGFSKQGKRAEKRVLLLQAWYHNVGSPDDLCEYDDMFSRSKSLSFYEEAVRRYYYDYYMGR